MTRQSLRHQIWLKTNCDIKQKVYQDYFIINRYLFTIKEKWGQSLRLHNFVIANLYSTRRSNICQGAFNLFLNDSVQAIRDTQDEVLPTPTHYAIFNFIVRDKPILNVAIRHVLAFIAQLYYGSGTMIIIEKLKGCGHYIIYYVN